MASVTHVALPMAADLVPEERRGQAIGTVMTGLLLGILLARTFAGWVSRLGSWRTVFVVAAVVERGVCADDLSRHAEAAAAAGR